MNKDTKQSNKPLKEALFERIDSEQVCPHSKLFFQGRECLVWSLWLLSVVVGALAIAVSLFVLAHRQYEIYEATHDNFFTFMVEVLPYIWIVIFALMVYVAIYNLRHTKHGYRYPLWVILVSSLALSFVGGSLLQIFGVGYVVDDVLGNYMPMYTSQEKLEYRLWQNPVEGRLIGMQVHGTLAPAKAIVFEDMAGQRWNMDISELQPMDMQLLATEQRVRLLGKEMDRNLRIFHACGVFPWMIDREVTMRDMSDERRAFVERVYRYAKKADERLVLLENETFSTSSPSRESVCANIAAVRRMPHEDSEVVNSR